MKVLLAIAVFCLPFFAKADLFDQRAASAARKQAEVNEQAQERYRQIRRAGAYTIAEAFGAQNGGAGEFTENSYWNGGLKSLRFVTGNGHACEVYPTLDTFFCYDKEERYLRFFRDHYVNYNRLTNEIAPRLVRPTPKRSR